MSNSDGALDASEKNHGWQVTFAGMGINLALGILYSWSVIKGGLTGEEWTASAKALPYSIACLVFCLAMVPAGRMQDRVGPRLVATIGGVLVGVGMIVAGLGESLTSYIVGFGVLAGAGIGFGYASATPPAVKWFPPAKTGLIAGIVVSGFGLASVYTAPVTKWLLADYGIRITMCVWGVAFFVVVVGLAQLLRPPHRVMQFVEGLGRAGELKARDAAPVKKEDFTPGEMLRTWQFWVLWSLYACGAGAGLMVISIAKDLVSQATGTISSAGVLGVLAVVGLAIGNGAGRIVAGMVSDKLGRKKTLLLFLICQAVLIGMLSLASPDSPLGSAGVIILMATLVGANYGSNLALFPAITKDFYGLKNFGVNYGLVFTAWGVGGFSLSLLAGWVKDTTGTFTYSYLTAAALLIVAAVVSLVIKAPHHLIEAETEAG